MSIRNQRPLIPTQANVSCRKTSIVARHDLKPVSHQLYLNLDRLSYMNSQYTPTRGYIGSPISRDQATAFPYPMGL